MIEDDYMEIGETALVPMQDGWFYHKESGKYLGPDGQVYDNIQEIQELDKE